MGERDAEALQRFRRVAENQAEKAAQALAFYQAQITTEVSEGATPRLTVRIQSGEPVAFCVMWWCASKAQRRNCAPFVRPMTRNCVAGHNLTTVSTTPRNAKFRIRPRVMASSPGALVVKKLTIDPEAGVADIELIYLSGPRYQLGAVSFVGDAPLR